MGGEIRGLSVVEVMVEAGLEAVGNCDHKLLSFLSQETRENAFYLNTVGEKTSIEVLGDAWKSSLAVFSWCLSCFGGRVPSFRFPEVQVVGAVKVLLSTVQGQLVF